MTVSSDDGYIHVNYGQVNDVYDALMDADKSIQMVISNLETVINPLLQSWQGISEGAWAQLQNWWNQEIGDMNALLAKSARTLEEMSINYGTTDNNLALQWEQIT
ncbi:MAG: WXG100 family type VII secretion target [Streptosporangiaceae bacterium]|jgi:WXG100 family type VII secretion target